MKELIQKIEELRELVYDNLYRDDDGDVEADSKGSFYWQRLNSGEISYIQKMLIDKSIKLKMNQENNIQEVFFVDDLIDKFK